jgi:hypothetical protein
MKSLNFTCWDKKVKVKQSHNIPMEAQVGEEV